MIAISSLELGVYRDCSLNQTVPLAAALAWAGAMRKRSKKVAGKPPKPKPVYMRKSISGPDETIAKGKVRAQLLGRSFSEHVMRLLEEDYARDERVVMTVAEPTEAYRAFREQHPPVLLEPPRQIESQPEGGG